MENEANEDIWVGHRIGDMTSHIRDYIRYATDTKAQHPKFIYYFGIVACACHFESVLKDFTLFWCKKKSSDSAEDVLYTNLMDKAVKEISEISGIESWKKWMKILFDINLGDALGKDKQPIEQLFKLRNNLAHGRTAMFTHYFRTNGAFAGSHMLGSPYEKSFTYLKEKKVISFPEGRVSADDILNAQVVSFFWKHVESGIKSLQAYPVLEGLQHYMKFKDSSGEHSDMNSGDPRIVARID